MRRGNVVLAALVVSAVAACSDPRAGTLPPPSPTPTPTVTVTSSPTDERAALEASLRTALRTYFDALYAAGLDPANKTDDLAALIHPACTCRKVVEVLREQGVKRRHVDYKYTLKSVQVMEADPRTGVVRYTVHQSAGALRDESGRAVESFAASTGQFSARFTRVDGQWQLRRLDAFR